MQFYELLLFVITLFMLLIIMDQQTFDQSSESQNSQQTINMAVLAGFDNVVLAIKQFLQRVKQNAAQSSEDYGTAFAKAQRQVCQKISQIMQAYSPPTNEISASTLLLSLEENASDSRKYQRGRSIDGNQEFRKRQQWLLITQGRLKENEKVLYQRQQKHKVFEEEFFTKRMIWLNQKEQQLKQGLNKELELKRFDQLLKKKNQLLLQKQRKSDERSREVNDKESKLIHYEQNLKHRIEKIIQKQQHLQFTIDQWNKDKDNQLERLKYQWQILKAAQLQVRSHRTQMRGIRVYSKKKFQPQSQ